MGLRDAERHPRELSSGRVLSSHTPVRAALGSTARNRSALNTSRGNGRAAHEKCLVSNQRTLGVQRPDLSYVKEPAQGVAPLASLSRFRARPGAQHLIEELLRQIAEAIPKSGEPGSVAAAQAVFGDMLGYWLVRPLQKLADLDRQSVGRDLLIKAFGKPEGERIFRSGLEGVDRLEREITVYREDLSNPR